MKDYKNYDLDLGHFDLKVMSFTDLMQKKVKDNLGIEIEYSWFYRYCKKYGIYDVLKK